MQEERHPKIVSVFFSGEWVHAEKYSRSVSLLAYGSWRRKRSTLRMQSSLIEMSSEIEVLE